jgi:hypothetical protein
VFIHQPYGAFDLTGEEGRFTPQTGNELPLDVFVVASSDPLVIMREYAGITGFPELPARWTLGYMQSSRTLAGPDEILGVARKFRERRLPATRYLPAPSSRLRAGTRATASSPGTPATSRTRRGCSRLCTSWTSRWWCTW